MSETALKKALDFIENEKQFHLGFLPSEQSNPLTKNLDKEFAKSTVDGVANLQSVDRNVLAMAKRIFASDEFKKLVDTGVGVIRSGGKIVFSGCGATGRLSILLECMWRDCCAKNPAAAKYADQVFSIMTGGDFALVRSVEFFEDYQSFGRRQVQEMGITDKDMLVAITEGGETSSVLGTVFESLDRGAAVFLMFNNPADLLAEPFPGQPIVEIAGDQQVLIENHAGVTAYSRESIQVKVKFGCICICGCGLEMIRMTKDQLVIRGKIEGVTLQRRGSA